jgi:hypothetical protein
MSKPSTTAPIVGVKRFNDIAMHDSSPRHDLCAARFLCAKIFPRDTISPRGSFGSAQA